MAVILKLVECVNQNNLDPLSWNELHYPRQPMKVIFSRTSVGSLTFRHCPANAGTFGTTAASQPATLRPHWPTVGLLTAQKTPLMAMAIIIAAAAAAVDADFGEAEERRD
uniref:Uncharacterized protein n=1 Tax=Globodera pallida TaxID=36090 RepID=A0A183CK95_GLOPA